MSEQLREKITGDKAAVVELSSFSMSVITNALIRLDETICSHFPEKRKKVLRNYYFGAEIVALV